MAYLVNPQPARDIRLVENAAALPLLGDYGNVYITVDTHLVYTWDGVSWVASVGGGGGGTWGSITGLMAAQTDLDNRFKTLENLEHVYEIYENIGTGTTGTLTKPAGSTILLDRYPNAGDALIVQCGTDSKPIDRIAVTAAGAAITSSFDTSGNYVFSGIPSAYPVSLVYQVKCKESVAAIIPLASIIQRTELVTVGDIDGLTLTLAGKVTTAQTTPQSIGDTTNRLTKLWATDAAVTNAITGAVTGNAGTVTNATLTTALTVSTGTVGLVGNVANTSVLTLGAGASSVAGENTGDQTLAGLGAVGGSGVVNQVPFFSGSTTTLAGDTMLTWNNTLKVLELDQMQIRTSNGTSQNFLLGYGSGANLTSGALNTFIGYTAGATADTCTGMLALGYASMYSTTNGYDCVAIGASSMSLGSANIESNAVGKYALYQVSGGYSNVANGFAAGRSLTTGSGDNTFIGWQAGYNGSQKTDAKNSMALGSGAYTTVDNQVVVGNESIVETQLKGSVVSGQLASLATTATDGFLYIPSCAGTPTGVPTAKTGKSPIVMDSTNHILYVYSGGSWVALN